MKWPVLLDNLHWCFWVQTTGTAWTQLCRAAWAQIMAPKAIGAGDPVGC